LIFPAYQAEAEVEPPPTPPVVEAETLAGSPRVLVVDDEPSVAQLITDVLRRLGCRVRLHTDSNRALQEALREPFELIICDLRMPGLDGRAFHRILNERNPELARRLLFITGDTLAADTRAFLDQVQLPHIPKPFLVEELRAAVKEWFSQAGRAVVTPADGKGRKVRTPGARKAGRRRTA
jgi:two-component system NtrC family sensor kinase